MSPTPDQLRTSAAAMIAFADGKPVQVRIQAEWQDTDNPQFDCSYFAYRPKPEPVTRPWSKPEDVPGPVCWIRFRQQSLPIHCAMIVGVIGKGVVTCDEKNGDAVEWKSLSDYYEHSTDRKTWLPCIVTQ